MSRYRTRLPQLGDGLFLTDGGIETTLIFHDGQELPHFAAFPLLEQPHGNELLRAYFRRYLDIAARTGCGFVLESATWRANPDWARRLGYSPERLIDANRLAITQLEQLRVEYDERVYPMVISGCVGPRGDGYDAGEQMSPSEAEAYHAFQLASFQDTAADLVTAITMTYSQEAIGIARACRNFELPVVLSFTVETDGRLPSGQSLASAIEQVDQSTDGYPAYYMINCAHPSHFDHLFDADEPWMHRIRGLRGNASCKSHAELDEAEELDEGHPPTLGREYAELKARLPRLNVLGGCCGTDHRHIEAIAKACVGPMPSRKAG